MIRLQNNKKYVFIFSLVVLLVFSFLALVQSQSDPYEVYNEKWIKILADGQKCHDQCENYNCGIQCNKDTNAKNAIITAEKDAAVAILREAEAKAAAEEEAFLEEDRIKTSEQEEAKRRAENAAVLKEADSNILAYLKSGETTVKELQDLIASIKSDAPKDTSIDREFFDSLIEIYESAIIEFQSGQKTQLKEVNLEGITEIKAGEFQELDFEVSKAQEKKAESFAEEKDVRGLKWLFSKIFQREDSKKSKEKPEEIKEKVSDKALTKELKVITDELEKLRSKPVQTLDEVIRSKQLTKQLFEKFLNEGGEIDKRKGDLLQEAHKKLTDEVDRLINLKLKLEDGKKRFADAERKFKDLVDTRERLDKGFESVKEQNILVEQIRSLEAQGKLGEAAKIRIKLVDSQLELKASYQQILEKNPNNIEANFGLANLYKFQGKNKEALELYQRTFTNAKGEDAALVKAQMEKITLENFGLKQRSTLTRKPEKVNTGFLASLGRDIRNTLKDVSGFDEEKLKEIAGSEDFDFSQKSDIERKAYQKSKEIDEKELTSWGLALGVKKDTRKAIERSPNALGGNAAKYSEFLIGGFPKDIREETPLTSDPGTPLSGDFKGINPNA